ncbi:hypothetical protein NLG97_g6421 [Lecanicillium saksenae]|uniref:Uncharacterized protein n=1 Tax=Lecanicillium saksenae TaxID=468837 RepID=A0ACC1QRD0_9HYPO|nr:hypothetical protein NLG97_g6421 [Lecanicillium saksenae]
MQLSLVASAALLLSAASSVLADDDQNQCTVNRKYPCEPWINEVHQTGCWTYANDVSSLINCVGSTSNDQWCQHFGKNRLGKYDNLANKPEDCIVPTEVLYAGAMDVNCKRSHVAGTIKRCTRLHPDKSFPSCICSWVHDHALQTISRCFKGMGHAVCGIYDKRAVATLSRRDSTESTRLSEDLEDSGERFYIDTYGRPIFIDDDDNVLPDSQDVSDIFPLTYFDHKYVAGAGPAIQRCYVYPFTDNLWCTEWLVSQEEWDQYADADGPRSGFKEGPSTGAPTSIASTETAAPDTATVPTLAASTNYDTLTGTEVTATMAPADVD